METSQTAFRFETDLLCRMKKRAKLQGKSVNRYVTDLIENDLLEAEVLPHAILPDSAMDLVASYAGKMRLPSKTELASDERLQRIWSR